jgi:hypothetical protein
MNSIENQSQYKLLTNFMNHNTIHDLQFEKKKMPLKIIGFMINSDFNFYKGVIKLTLQNVILKL